MPVQKRVQNEPPMMFHRIGVTVLADRSDSEDCRSLVITTALGGVLCLVHLISATASPFVLPLNVPNS